MLRKVKIYGLMCCIVLGMSFSCSNKKYDYNSTAVPVGLNYSYYNYGPGTSYTEGALVINIQYSNTTRYNEYYIVQVYGVGTYTLQYPYNQVFIPNLLPNYYNFSIQKVCNGGNNSNCTPRTLSGLATINADMTTVVDAWL